MLLGEDEEDDDEAEFESEKEKKLAEEVMENECPPILITTEVQHAEEKRFRLEKWIIAAVAILIAVGIVSFWCIPQLGIYQA